MLTNDFVKTIFGKTNGDTTAEYSRYMLSMLLADNFVECVFDTETGEILGA